MNHNIFLVLAVICFGIVGYLFFFKPYPELIQNPEIMEEKQEQFEKQVEDFSSSEDESFKGITLITEEEGNCITNCYNNTCETSCL